MCTGRPDLVTGDAEFVRDIVDAAAAKLLLFGRNGFSPDVVTAAGRRDDVELIDLDRLYVST